MTMDAIPIPAIHNPIISIVLIAKAKPMGPEIITAIRVQNISSMSFALGLIKRRIRSPDKIIPVATINESADDSVADRIIIIIMVEVHAGSIFDVNQYNKYDPGTPSTIFFRNTPIYVGIKRSKSVIVSGIR